MLMEACFCSIVTQRVRPLSDPGKIIVDVPGLRLSIKAPSTPHIPFKDCSVLHIRVYKQSLEEFSFVGLEETAEKGNDLVEHWVLQLCTSGTARPSQNPTHDLVALVRSLISFTSRYPVHSATYIVLTEEGTLPPHWTHCWNHVAGITVSVFSAAEANRPVKRKRTLSRTEAEKKENSETAVSAKLPVKASGATPKAVAQTESKAKETITASQVSTVTVTPAVSATSSANLDSSPVRLFPSAAYMEVNGSAFDESISSPLPHNPLACFSGSTTEKGVGDDSVAFLCGTAEIKRWWEPSESANSRASSLSPALCGTNFFHWTDGSVKSLGPSQQLVVASLPAVPKASPHAMLHVGTRRAALLLLLGSVGLFPSEDERETAANDEEWCSSLETPLLEATSDYQCGKSVASSQESEAKEGVGGRRASLLIGIKACEKLLMSDKGKEVDVAAQLKMCVT